MPADVTRIRRVVAALTEAAWTQVAAFLPTLAIVLAIGGDWRVVTPISFLATHLLLSWRWFARSTTRQKAQQSLVVVYVESGENISRARMFARETAKWLPAILVHVVGTAAGLPQGLGLLWLAIGLVDLMWSGRTAWGRLTRSRVVPVAAP